MTGTEIDTVVVGAGQAGIAASEHLRGHGIGHVVLERARIAERWRSARWDSLVANGPAWHDRFPGLEFQGHGPDEFVPKEDVADYMERYASMIDAPVRCGVQVVRVARNMRGSGFVVETSDGTYLANHVIAATGPYQKPVFPKIVPADAGLHQIHSTEYRNPATLPKGAVLVVGAGSSGAQIAEELMNSGRETYLSVGKHDRPPRSYRGKDFVWWLGVLGKWDKQSLGSEVRHTTIAVSGADGGKTVDFRRFAAAGMKLVGVSESYTGGSLRFAGDIKKNLDRGDANHLSVLDEADAYVERNGLELPEDPDARRRWPEPDCVDRPIRKLNLAESGVTSIVWATGFTTDYGWLEVDALDEAGHPRHQRGISSEPGVYFLGLPWQSSRGSSFIWGVWHDARFIADQIAIRRSYHGHRSSGRSVGLDKPWLVAKS